MEHTPLMGKEGSLTCLKDGVLLFTTESLDGIGYSDDGGRTWEIIDFKTPREDKYSGIGTVRAPIIHPDGTISFMRCVGYIYALHPYHIEPPETGQRVCHAVRWKLPPNPR